MSPNDSIDWDLGKAPKQSITEVLQDPRGPTIELPDISNIDLSTSSLTLTPVTPTNLPPPLNINHFESYLRRYAPLYQTYQQNIHSSPNEPHQQHEHQHKKSTEPIPSEFFDSNYDVSSYIRIPDSSSSSTSSSTSTSTSTSASAFKLSSNKEIKNLRNELIQYKQQLELDLTKQLNSKSEQINLSLKHLNKLREEIELTLKTLRETKKLTNEFPLLLIKPIEKINKLSQIYKNIKAIRKSIILINSIHQIPNDINDLLQIGEYATCIQHIDNSKQILLQLGNIYALKDIRKQLMSSLDLIDTALRNEFYIALMEEDSNTMLLIVKLIEKINRGGLVILRKLFVNDIINNLKSDLSTIYSLSNAMKIIKIAINRSILLIKIIHDYHASQINEVDEKDHHGILEAENGTLSLAEKKKALLSSSSSLSIPSNDGSLSDISFDEDLKQLRKDFEEIIASFVDRLLGSFQAVVIDTPPPISPSNSNSNYDINTNQSKGNETNNTTGNTNNNNINSNLSNDTPTKTTTNDNEVKNGNRSFLVITKLTALTENTCFDEFKAALKFGEEMKSLEQIATDIETLFGEFQQENSSIKPSSSPSKISSSRLRAKLTEKLMAFVTAFHRAHVDEITNSVRRDKWTEVAVPAGASKLLSAVISSNISNQSSSIKSDSANHNLVRGANENVFVIDNEVYRTVNCGIRFVRSICAYALLSEQSPISKLSVEISRRGTELSRLFNNLVCQAILGVAALQWSGLRSITARHLSLASRVISLTLRISEDIHKVLEKILVDNANSFNQIQNQEIVLSLIKKSEDDLKVHHKQLIEKIIEVMIDRLNAHEQSLKKLPWDKKIEIDRFEIPSKYITTLVKETTVLHRILWYVLPVYETINVFFTVWKKFADTLEEAYGNLDGGKQWIRDRVADDVTWVYQSFGKLDVSSQENGKVFKSVAALYERFAREAIEERAERKIQNERSGALLRAEKEKEKERERERQKELDRQKELERQRVEKEKEIEREKEREIQLEKEREQEKKNDEEVNKMMEEMLGDKDEKGAEKANETTSSENQTDEVDKQPQSTDENVQKQTDSDDGNEENGIKSEKSTEIDSKDEEDANANTSVADNDAKELIPDDDDDDEYHSANEIETPIPADVPDTSTDADDTTESASVIIEDEVNTVDNATQSNLVKDDDPQVLNVDNEEEPTAGSGEENVQGSNSIPAEPQRENPSSMDEENELSTTPEQIPEENKETLAQNGEIYSTNSEPNSNS